MSAVSPLNALQIVASEITCSLTVDRHDLEGARAALAAPTQRWFTTGQGRSGLVAAMVAMRLMHLGHDAHLVGEATAPSVRAGDGLILFSRSGTTPITVAQAQTASAEGATVMAVTENADSPLAGAAKVVLRVPAGPSQQFGGSRFEQAALVLFDGIMFSLAPSPESQRTMQYRHDNLH
ncbi:SIS domain-containing protein [Arthrobacter sp. Soil736]|uniref:SIS domain-containing protein n=1 Tax=Arthrobacter sp. Soil736 TaxID=1736395 RepID=UPI0009EBCB1D|nr:SIS domain-containing protein [Arthrobacter sp. Soil736]